MKVNFEHDSPFPKKKCLTTFLRNGIGLKNFNLIVFYLHKINGRKEVKILGGIVVVNFVSGF